MVCVKWLKIFATLHVCEWLWKHWEYWFWSYRCILASRQIHKIKPWILNSCLNNSTVNNFTGFNFNMYFWTSLHPGELLMGESEKNQLIPSPLQCLPNCVLFNDNIPFHFYQLFMRQTDLLFVSVRLWFSYFILELHSCSTGSLKRKME